MDWRAQIKKSSIWDLMSIAFASKSLKVSMVITPLYILLARIFQFSETSLTSCITRIDVKAFVQLTWHHVLAHILSDTSLQLCIRCFVLALFVAVTLVKPLSQTHLRRKVRRLVKLSDFLIHTEHCVEALHTRCYCFSIFAKVSLILFWTKPLAWSFVAAIHQKCPKK